MLTQMQADRKQFKERTEPLVAKANQEVKELETMGDELHAIDRQFNRDMNKTLIAETWFLVKCTVEDFWESLKTPFEKFSLWRSHRRIEKTLRYAHREAERNRKKNQR